MTKPCRFCGKDLTLTPDERIARARTAATARWQQPKRLALTQRPTSDDRVAVTDPTTVIHAPRCPCAICSRR